MHQKIAGVFEKRYSPCRSMHRSVLHLERVDHACKSEKNDCGSTFSVPMRICTAWGITVRDIRELDRLILDGIRGMLAEHGICAAVIDQYLDECGRILYTTTQDQQAMAHLNYFCEQVGFFSEAFIPIKQFQTHLLQSLNEDSVKFDEEYADPRQKLRDSFSEHYPGQSVLFQKMAVLDIKLVNAPCFRRLCIPSHYSLMKLHWAIQILFSWKDAHLHVF